MKFGWQSILSAGVGAALGAAAWPAAGQNSSRYTMPDPAAPAAPARPDGPGVVGAPSTFHADSGDANLPLPPAPANDFSVLDQLKKDKKNWILMSPEEIMGIATPDKPKTAEARNPYALDPGRLESTGSPLRDFLRSERRAHDASFETGDAEAAANLYPHDRSKENQLTLAPDHNTAPGSMEQLQHLLSAPGKNGFLHNDDADWSTIFKSPAPPKPTPEEEAQMRAFEEMINPKESRDDKKNPANDSRRMPSASAAGSSDAMFPEKNNPAAHGLNPFEDGTSRPQRAPMPSVTATYTNSAPAWGPQPPPWTQSGPQLFVQPTRKF